MQVRRESIKVLHLILSNVALEKIDPFFDIMCTYLRSAMTHIDSRIQEDSLLFLDTLLLCTPKKVAQDFYKIIPNFLDMISKLRVDSKPGRTLTINLDSQITSVKWRVKVLHRLKDFLNSFVECHNIHGIDQSMATTHNFDKTKLNHYALFNPSYTSVCFVSCFSSRNLHDTMQLNEVEKFKEYIETLMPLLFETWIEVCPNMNTEKNMETVVSEDAAILLKHTLEVISLLWELVQYLNQKNPSSNIETLFCQKYRQSFNQHFVNSFPFVTNLRTKQNKANKDSPFEDLVTDPKLVTENLDICHLFIMLNPFVNVKSQNKDIESVLHYIEKTFNQNTHDDINDVVIKILHTIFSNEVTSWTKTLLVMDALFRKIIWAYFNKDMSNIFKQKIFSLLCKIALNDKLGHFHVSEAYEKWLNNLPDILLEETITVQTIDIIQKFAVRNNTTFNTVIKPKLLSIIENLPKLKVSDAKYDTNSYHKLFSLLYWIKSWDCDSLNLLEKQLMDSAYKSGHGKYIFDTLRLKSGGIL